MQFPRRDRIVESEAPICMDRGQERQPAITASVPRGELPEAQSYVTEDMTYLEARFETQLRQW